MFYNVMWGFVKPWWYKNAATVLAYYTMSTVKVPFEAALRIEAAVGLEARSLVEC